jgi:two-component system CheB/CheR fusion protein
MNRIVDSSGRMSRLIDDLLNFSRVSRSSENFTMVDLNRVVKGVLKTFDLTIQKTGAEINIGLLPGIEAVPVQMMQLFHNLFSNALKFTDKEKPVVSISSHALTKEEIAQYPSLPNDKNFCEIVVSDNGIGFKQEYADQIFQIFQRLHGKSEFPGTGIGLALCRKIVESHEGIIYANSKEKEGASFHVILPVK